MKLNISNSSLETGALLKEYLEERGANITGKGATVCYGWYNGEKGPSLNSRCCLSKIERMELMKKAGVSTVPWFDAKNIPYNINFPLLARTTQGHGGTDIVPVFQSQEIEWRIKSGWDWFSEYVPIKKEFRVWVFQGIHLDTYEKVMMRPKDFKHIGRNFRNGFDFKLTNYHQVAFYEAAIACQSLGFDFGAVDLILGEDDKCYILEVNTAPGCIKSGAQKTLGKLADCIIHWEKDGYKQQ